MAQNALPVISAATADRYRGSEAVGYEARRRRQERWWREDAAILELLGSFPPATIVMDIPVGTGRFLPFYAEKDFAVIGFDVSQDMLAVAGGKPAPTKRGLRLLPGDVLNIPLADLLVDVAVCVRLLNLISEAEMQRAVGELCRVARKTVVLSIRLGDTPWRRRASITHTDEAFAAAIPEGWAVDANLDLLDQGYRMIRLSRRQP